LLELTLFTLITVVTGAYPSSAFVYMLPYAYSPVHNVKSGVRYPAILVTTADHDDRVVPAHSFKYAAALQDHLSGDRPALIRIEVNSGHSASSTGKSIEILTDLYTFMFDNLGITPKL